MKRLFRFWLMLTVLVLSTQIKLYAQDPDNYPPVVQNISVDSTNLPIVYIEVNGDTILKDEKITARMKIIWNENGQWNFADTIAHPNQNIDYNGYISINYRGNTTYTTSPKKSYTIRTLTQPLEAGGKKQKVSLLGMGKDNNWALLANHSDRSMMRNLLSYGLARPFVEFSPKGKYCEVFVDGIYYGVYTLIEKVTKGKFRLNLTEPEEEGDALTGDYLLEIDRPGSGGFVSKYYPVDSEGNEITTAQKNVYQFDEPDLDEITYTQTMYIRNKIWQMEQTLVEGGAENQFADENSLIDIQSFIDYTLSNEFAHNNDAYRLSTKIYKRRDSVDPKFKLSIWDMDLTFGCTSNKTNEGVYDNHTYTWIGIPRWVDALTSAPSFNQFMRNRWQEYRQEIYTEEHVYAMMDSLSSQLTMGGAIDRNARAWKIFDKHLWPNYFDAKNYDEEVNYMKQWIHGRFAFLDYKLLGIALDGDVNIDGKVNVSDVTALVNMILGVTTLDETAADVDRNGKVNVSDLTSLVNIILGII